MNDGPTAAAHQLGVAISVHAYEMVLENAYIGPLADSEWDIVIAMTRRPLGLVMPEGGWVLAANWRDVADESEHFVISVFSAAGTHIETVEVQ